MDSTFASFTPLVFLLAQEGAGKQASPSGQLLPLVVPVLAAIALYYFMILRPDGRKRATHQSQLDSLKKNDRVVTIGGIYGVVMNVQKDADEVVLKVDEATNTKIRVTFGAIGRVLSDEPPAEKPA